MNLELVKEIYNIHKKWLKELNYEVIKKEDYEIIYNKNIKDCYSNFISNFDVKDIDEFKKIISESEKDFSKANRTPVIYLIPFMNELYNNKDKYFTENKFELISTEAWQIFNDFSKLENMKINCKFDVKLELATDMEEYAKCLMECYKTDDEDDPYGGLDDGYKLNYINHRKIYDDIENEFYLIKADDKIVGTTQSIHNDKICGLYSLAIKNEYRNKSIGKEVLKQQLEICKSKNIDAVYLQTEEGFYPYEMYKKFGFEDLCMVYYYSKL